MKKIYKFNVEETSLIYTALNFACIKAKKELEYDIKLNITLGCKSIVEHDKAICAVLEKLKEITRRHDILTIEGE